MDEYRRTETVDTEQTSGVGVAGVFPRGKTPVTEAQTWNERKQRET